ncbi:SipW-cognate class signal peptide [Lachnospiraceae bacterium XBB1006]|nr:SipW-cognate class signal peptide [Lachnospiraceae bacterium XBB1006]
MKKQIKLTAAILGVVMLATVGATAAYFTQDGTRPNQMTTSSLNVNIEEDIEDGYKNDIKAVVCKNHAACWVRVYVGIPVGNEGKKIFKEPILNNEEGEDVLWIKKDEDGYYYYNKPIPAGKEEVSLSLFKKNENGHVIEPVEGLTIKDMPSNTDIIVYAETIQYNDGDTSCVEAFKNFKPQQSTTN